MPTTLRLAGAAACLAGVALSVLLSGCTTDDTPDSGRDTASPRPVTTSTAAPEPAARLAERYRASGGLPEVYGIRRSPGPGGAPLLTVWTREVSSDNDLFQELKSSVTTFLRREEGVSFEKGYQMDVFGSEGRLKHRLDARP